MATPSGEEPVRPKRKRNLPGMPDPDAEVIALSPKSLMETNKYVCDICGKGFQRDQNLQLHRRGHNLPWRLKQRPPGNEVKKKVYICPEPSCAHHDPARALGDLTGIKKHFCRKHGEKKFKCDKCSKCYAVLCDWKAHSKICGTREYPCDCGTVFSRRDSFVTHRAFCDALAQESARSSHGDGLNLSGAAVNPKLPLVSSSPPPQPLTPSTAVLSPVLSIQSSDFPENQTSYKEPPLPLPPLGGGGRGGGGGGSSTSSGGGSGQETAFSSLLPPPSMMMSLSLSPTPASMFLYDDHFSAPPPPPPAISATALLQKAAAVGSKSSTTFLQGLGLAMSTPGDQGGANREKKPMFPGLSLGLHSPPTLDFLGLESAANSSDRFPAMLGGGGGRREHQFGMDGSSSFAGILGGHSWDDSSEQKPGFL